MSENIYKTIGDLGAAAAKTGTELVEVFQGDESKKMTVGELTKFNSYDVAIGNTAQLDLNSQVFTIDNTTATAKAIALPAQMPAGRATTLVVVIRGKAGTVTWDSAIKWSGNTAPVLADNVTVGVLLWDGQAVHGSAGVSY